MAVLTIIIIIIRIRRTPQAGRDEIMLMAVLSQRLPSYTIQGMPRYAPR